MSPPIIFAPPPSPPPTPPMPEASLTTQERLRLAKRRRAAQLKRWAQREREKNQPDVVKGSPGGMAMAMGMTRKSGKRRGVEFVANVMLLEAAARNDVEEVRRLLELGVTPDSTNEDGLTALHQCCIDDSEEMMKVLVDYGGNANATDTEKWTPLHAAATCGHLHLVKFLIDNGADLLAVNADGNMPYDLCEDDTTLSYIENEMAKRGVTQELIDETRATTERKMLRDLQSAPSDYLEARDKHGATPLHIAAANGYLSVVEFLLDNHVTTDSVDNDLWQPIHAAACWGHLEVVEMLAQNGANIIAKTKNGETPFDICEDPEIKERLIQLKEQRVRLDQPRVRRSRSASTRTQSIRRTSLRDKMNTTKKDVQDEKLYFIKSFDSNPKTGNENMKSDDSSPESRSKPVVDINDVEVTLLPYVNDKPSSNKNQENRNENQNQDVPAIPPKRPARTGKEGSPVSPIVTSASGEKINIHVSVTINTPNGSQSPQGSTGSALYPNSGSNSPGGTTLADLKKARSMSRTIIGSPVVSTPPQPAASHSHQSFSHAHNLNPSPKQQSFHPSSLTERSNVGDDFPPTPPPKNPKAPPVNPIGKNSTNTRISQQQSTRTSDSRSARDSSSGKELGNNNGLQKFSSSDNEVVGPPPKKSGCCIIM